MEENCCVFSLHLMMMYKRIHIGAFSYGITPDEREVEIRGKAFKHIVENRK
jgi:hypothetical protein